MLSSDTKMVLVNAVFFKGTWKIPFDESHTSKQPFFITDKKSVVINMMYKSENLPYAKIKEIDSKVVVLPYEGGLSMVIVLPNQRMGLDALDDKLKSTNIVDIINSINVSPEVRIRLPKFKIVFEINLLKDLAKLGMTKMSTPGEAEFPDLLENTDPIYISKVIHKAFIEVNETGTVAAAATAIEFINVSLEEYFDFNVDHPFRFFIRNAENIILFDGCFCGPAK